MKPTSAQAYRQHIASGDAKTQRDRLFAYIDRHPGHTRLELSQALNIPINAVAGRVHELMALRVIEEGTPRPCRKTGRSAAPLYVLEPAPRVIGADQQQRLGL